MTDACRIHRHAYRPSPFQLDTISLDVCIGEEETLVRACQVLHRQGPGELQLDGEALDLRALRVDGVSWEPDRFELTPEALILPGLGDTVTIETLVAIRPQDNSELSGLYRSGALYCTQCEAHGFRRITFALDRPDVMGRYTCRIEADRASCPVLLSNGNLLATEDLPAGRHAATWADPHPKPSYLFALVAGDLHCAQTTYTTAEGRRVSCELYVEHGNEDRCAHALASLQKAMAWDEQRFGLSYDLDRYLIVAVSDFNMGAMENKGLNIFNAKYVLAKPETATDADYEAIEAVIAHEYFHNWTGNRVTCRDWFQLTLKEGLTVFRDQEFTADQTDAAVKRIDDVTMLTTSQFPEDAGPMAHPIRPESYISMDNFYTVTVYEKGAEVVRLYQTLLGRAGFRKGMDCYFQRHDGAAVTCDDFRAAMADANGIDLASFERWYDQAGTPILVVDDDFQDGRYRLRLRQQPPANQPDNRPVPLPIALGLLDAQGAEVPLPAHPALREVDGRMLFLLEQDADELVLEGLQARPVPSILRGFSAPVRLMHERSAADLAHVMTWDRDPYQRWQAGQELAQGLILKACATGAFDPARHAAFLDAWVRLLDDRQLDGCLCAQALSLPSERLLGDAQTTIDPVAVHHWREMLSRECAERARPALLARYHELAASDETDRRHAAIAARRLKHTCLGFLSRLDEPAIDTLIWQQFTAQQTMTEREAALAILCATPHPRRAEALALFHDTWRHDALVLDKWFSLQARSPLSDAAVIEDLMAHPAFTLRNPNRLRSLVGVFAMANQLRFHAADGAGYRLLGRVLVELDALNPQIAARLVGAFNHWRRFDPARQELMRSELVDLSLRPDLSADVREIVQAALGEQVEAPTGV